MDHVAAERAGRAESMPGDLGVASHRLDPSRHRFARRYATMPSIVLPSASTPVAEVASAAAAQRSVPPGRPVDREHQRTVHGDPRVALDQVVRLEPLHPAQDGVGTSTRPDGVGDLQHEARHRVGIAGGLGVVDRGLRHPVRLAPRRGAAVELGDDLRLASPQLRQRAALGTGGGTGTTPGVGRAGPPAGCGAPTARGARSIPWRRGRRRRADRTSGRGSTCGSGTMPPRTTPGRGSPSAGSRR